MFKKFAKLIKKAKNVPKAVEESIKQMEESIVSTDITKLTEGLPIPQLEKISSNTDANNEAKPDKKKTHPKKSNYINDKQMVSPLALLHKKKFKFKEKYTFTEFLFKTKEVGILTMSLNKIYIFNNPANPCYIIINSNKSNINANLAKVTASDGICFKLDNIKSCTNSYYLEPKKSSKEGEHEKSEIILRIPIFDISSSIFFTVWETRTLTSPRLIGEWRLPLNFVTQDIFTSSLVEPKMEYEDSADSLSKRGISITSSLIGKQFDLLSDSQSLQKYWKKFATANKLVKTKTCAKAESSIRFNNKSYQMIKSQTDQSYIEDKIGNSEKVMVDTNLFKGLVSSTVLFETSKSYSELLMVDCKDETVNKEETDYKLSTNLERAKILKYLGLLGSYYKLVKSWDQPKVSSLFLVIYTYLLLFCKLHQVPILMIYMLISYGIFKVFSKRGQTIGKVPNFASKKEKSRFSKHRANLAKQINKTNRMLKISKDGEASIVRNMENTESTQNSSSDNKTNTNAGLENYQAAVNMLESDEDEQEDTKNKPKMGLFNKFSYYKSWFYYTNELAAKVNSNFEKIANVLNFYCLEVSVVFYCLMCILLLSTSLLLWYVPFNVLVYFSTIKHILPDKQYFPYQVKNMKRKKYFYLLFHPDHFFKKMFHNFWSRIPDDFKITKDFISRKQILDIDYACK